MLRLHGRLSTRETVFFRYFQNKKCLSKSFQRANGQARVRNANGDVAAAPSDKPICSSHTELIDAQVLTSDYCDNDNDDEYEGYNIVDYFG